MTSLVRFDPFAEFAGLRRVFGFPSVQVWRNADTTLTFPIDLSETDDQIVVKAALAGIKPDEVNVSIDDGVLTIMGEMKRDETSERENYYRQELRYGAFSRSIALPSAVDHEKAEAEFKDGLLTVTLPKAEETRPKQITVKVGATNGAATDASAGTDTDAS